MRQEVVLAMLAKEPSHGYELRARLRDALGPVGEAMNPGQVYVTLTRLHLAAGQRQEAGQVLERLLQRNPKHPLGLQLLRQLGGGG